MNLFIFFALPFATILLAIVLQKILRSPFLVAITFFSLFLIVSLTAYIVMISCRFKRRFCHCSREESENQRRCSCENNNENTESNLLRISCSCGNSDRSSDLLTVDSTCLSNNTSNEANEINVISNSNNVDGVQYGNATQNYRTRRCCRRI